MGQQHADHWISAFIEGTITANEFASLKRWLAESPEHADHYMSQVVLLRQLRGLLARERRGTSQATEQPDRSDV